MKNKESFDFTGFIGIAEIEITPPIGIYNRCWGAATSHTAQGIHMPFYATATVIGETKPLVIIGFDASWWMGCLPADCIKRIADELETKESQVHLCMSHTHAGVPIIDAVPQVPGAGLHAAYVKELYERLYQVAINAAKNRQPSFIQSNYGKCGLARNRELLHDESYVMGYDPDGVHDDTLFTARITNETNETIAVIINYACHPTTLAWENDQLSPDYIGALRETIRNELHVPMIFLQGCSGDLGPALGFTGDLSVPERHGRQLAYASLSSIENLSSPGTALVLEEIKFSGADLGIWREQTLAADNTFQCSKGNFKWPIRDGLLKSEEIKELLKQDLDNVEEERLRRKLRVRDIIGEGDDIEFKCWFARMGHILFVSFPGEAYSKMQKDLRAQFPEYTVICVNVCGGWIGYVLPKTSYNKPNLYPAWQTPLAPGAFEALYELCIQELNTLTEN